MSFQFHARPVLTRPNQPIQIQSWMYSTKCISSLQTRTARSRLQMAKSFNYRKKWIDNFAKCPLVDLNNKVYLHQIGYQLFYGKSANDYPAGYPYNFNAFYNTSFSMERGDALDDTLKFLHFIGITLSREALDAHLRLFPEQYHLFLKKAYYILRTIAHQNEDFDSPGRSLSIRVRASPSTMLLLT